MLESIGLWGGKPMRDRVLEKRRRKTGGRCNWNRRNREISPTDCTRTRAVSFSVTHRVALKNLSVRVILTVTTTRTITRVHLSLGKIQAQLVEGDYSDPAPWVIIRIHRSERRWRLTLLLASVAKVTWSGLGSKLRLPWRTNRVLSILSLDLNIDWLTDFKLMITNLI